MDPVVTGLQRVLAGDALCLRNRRIGLIVNPTAVDNRLRHAIDLFHRLDGVQLRLLFGPEHGIRGEAQDMIAVSDRVDPQTGVPVQSLYGTTVDTLVPSAEALSKIDVLVFDIQDVGARYYTYIWTLVGAMRACAGTAVEVVVLDRPNPIGGIEVEGGGIIDSMRSFVGLLPLPNRHGLTVGEIAGWACKREQLDVDLAIVPMIGWTRDMHFAATGLPWVMPSPNMPTYDTALVYPGMCLVEGTCLSEGRGTTKPFEIFGAPFIDGTALAKVLAQDCLPGVCFRPLTFTPTFHKFAGTTCGGLQLHVTDRNMFRPYRTGVAILRAVHALWPQHFAWREEPYEFEKRNLAIDLLCGSSEVRLGIERGDSLEQIAATWEFEHASFTQSRADYLLYREGS